MELKPLFQNIAAAIREKDGSTESIVASAFPERIRAIPAGGGGTEITHKKSVEVVARDKIQIGDTVYTIDGAYAPVITGLDGNVDVAAFSPDGSLLVLGGDLTGRAKAYSVNGTTVTYLSDLYANTWNTALNGSVRTAAFSPDGSLLVLGGAFSSFASVYSVSGTTITFLRNLYAAIGIAYLNSYVRTVAFSPDGSLLVLGGNFTGKAKVYSVSGTTVTYLSDIYANAGTTSITGLVNVAAFSPDGSLLVLGGEFAGRAKAYSVNGTTVTYLSDLYANTGTTALDSRCMELTFSPDGSLLVLGGNFTGKAKVYSVSGTTVTYLRDLYANVGSTALSQDVYAAAFSPDGSLLVLGGYFTGRAKVYAVSGNAFTWISDLYTNAGTAPPDAQVNAAAFSPDGGTLVLGGQFKQHAIAYQVTAPFTIAYVPGEQTAAYPTDQAKFSVPFAGYTAVAPVGIGYADQTIEAGETGTVQVIFEVS